jgi:Kef-type K+ transport system membrane component KefB
MTFLHNFQNWVDGLNLPVFLIIGLFAFGSYFLGNAVKRIRLPSIIGFMAAGVLLGPSLLNLLSDSVTADLSFITSVALSFVALSIGLELKFSSIRREGKAIVLIILCESLLAFVLVFLVVYLISGDLLISLLFGALAPPSAPAGTVAVIQEFKARGKLTNALYAVVGFDDGLGIVIYGFASAIAMSILATASGGEALSVARLIAEPFFELSLSIAIGAVAAFLFTLISKNKRSTQELFILTATFIFLTTGVCELFGFPFILANMVLGIVIVNTQSSSFVQKIRDVLGPIMPFLFLLFFTLAGANLHVSVLPALGLVGAGYIAARSAGKIAGATLGAIIGKAQKVLKKYVGIGILSQAGVAIGLSLVLKQELTAFGPRGVEIGSKILTTITATSIVFEIIGPIFAKLALKRAGEIGK